MSKHVRKYQMRPIPREISETGGFSAQFVQGEEGTVDAFEELMATTIEKSGVKISADVGKVVTKQFLLDCLNYVARTGKTLVIAGVLVIRLAIRGSYKNKDSQVRASNVRVSVYFLNEAKPLFTFSLSNVLDGKTLLLASATTPGHEYKHVVQGAQVLINGQYTKILEGDKVTASMKGAEGMIEAECSVVESDDSHILVQMPSAFNDPALVGKPISFTVESRCGDPEAGTQTKTTEATLDKGEIPSTDPTITKVTSGYGDDADVIYKAESVYVHGERFAATQDDTVTITKGDTDTWEWTGNNLTVVDADGKLALNYMGCKHNGEAGSFYVGDDPCELTVSFKGSTRTVQYKPARG